uniref:Uncharacterized protein n=2 Tax=Physcomitrium patens TaxID=3218 RepID=A0A7I4CK56_PHYPA
NPNSVGRPAMAETGPFPLAQAFCRSRRRRRLSLSCVEDSEETITMSPFYYYVGAPHSITVPVASAAWLLWDLTNLLCDLFGCDVDVVQSNVILA